MPSIRKTKKRLKRRIAELNKGFAHCDMKCLRGYLLADALGGHIQILETELKQLKGKK